MTDVEHDLPALAGAALAGQYQPPPAGQWAPAAAAPAFVPYRAPAPVDVRRWWQRKPNPAELTYRANCDRIRDGSWETTRRVVVASPKSNAKTPTSVIIGGILATHRGGGVIAWDASEAAGTIRARVSGPQELSVSVVAGQPERFTTRAGISRAVATQPSNLDVMGSLSERHFTAQDVTAVTAVLDPYYPIQIADTGSNALHAGAYKAVLNQAHLVVVPTTLTIDSVNKSAELVYGLVADARRVVVIISHFGAGVTHSEAVKMFLRAGATSIHGVPWDQHIAAGALLDPARLSTESLRSWTSAAAAITDQLKGITE